MGDLWNRGTEFVRCRGLLGVDLGVFLEFFLVVLHPLDDKLHRFGM